MQESSVTVLGSAFRVPRSTFYVPRLLMKHPQDFFNGRESRKRLFHAVFKHGGHACFDCRPADFARVCAAHNERADILGNLEHLVDPDAAAVAALVALRAPL